MRIFIHLPHYSLILLASSLLMVPVAVYILKHRRDAVSITLALMMLAAAVCSTGYALELAGPDREAACFWTGIAFAGSAFLPPLWFYLAIHYTGKVRPFPRRWLPALLLAYPLIATALYSLDLMPLTLCLTCLLVLWGAFRYRLLEPVPVVRERLFDITGDGVIVVDRAGTIIDYNQAARQITGVMTADALGLPLKTVLRDYPELAALYNREQSPSKEPALSTALEINGGYYQIRVYPVLESNGACLGKMIILHDITEDYFLIQKLNYLANYDDLTELRNRRSFLELGERELERAVASGCQLSMIIIDLDYFKSVNDTYGHQSGDAVLEHVAELCRDCIRSSDIIGRYGGEELMVLLPNTGPVDAVIIAERIRQRIAEAEVWVSGVVVKITASLGVTGGVPHVGETLADMVQMADRALYQAKAAGRNCVRVCGGAGQRGGAAGRPGWVRPPGSQAPPGWPKNGPPRIFKPTTARSVGAADAGLRHATDR